VLLFTFVLVSMPFVNQINKELPSLSQQSFFAVLYPHVPDEVKDGTEITYTEMQKRLPFMRDLPVYIEHDPRREVGRVVDCFMNDRTVYVGFRFYNTDEGKRAEAECGPTKLYKDVSLCHYADNAMPVEVSITTQGYRKGSSVLIKASKKAQDYQYVCGNGILSGTASRQLVYQLTQTEEKMEVSDQDNNRKRKAEELSNEVDGKGDTRPELLNEEHKSKLPASTSTEQEEQQQEEEEQQQHKKQKVENSDASSSERGQSTGQSSQAESAHEQDPVLQFLEKTLRDKKHDAGEVLKVTEAYMQRVNEERLRAVTVLASMTGHLNNDPDHDKLIIQGMLNDPTIDEKLKRLTAQDFLQYTHSQKLGQQQAKPAETAVSKTTTRAPMSTMSSLQQASLPATPSPSPIASSSQQVATRNTNSVPKTRRPPQQDTRVVNQVAFMNQFRQLTSQLPNVSNVYVKTPSVPITSPAQVSASSNPNDRPLDPNALSGHTGEQFLHTVKACAKAMMNNQKYLENPMYGTKLSDIEQMLRDSTLSDDIDHLMNPQRLVACSMSQSTPKKPSRNFSMHQDCGFAAACIMGTPVPLPQGAYNRHGMGQHMVQMSQAKQEQLIREEASSRFISNLICEHMRETENGAFAAFLA
jgi:hypothetical protein